MEDWELFVRGIVKSFDEFYKQMVEKGRDSAVPMQPVEEKRTRSVKKRSIPRRELGDLEYKIIDSIRQFEDGCTLKEIAKSLDMQWHYLRIPLRQLVLDGKVEKDGKLYSVEQEPREKTLVERDGIKRRVVDAKAFDAPKAERKAPVSVEMNPREKEILRFKVQTAFRGRPEGLTMVELAAVLGRDMEGLHPIIDELSEEGKIVEGNGGKYHLT